MHFVECCETGSSAQVDNKVIMVHVSIVVYISKHNLTAFFCFLFQDNYETSESKDEIVEGLQTVELKRTIKRKNNAGSLQSQC